jgi:hypothetical protein
MRPRANPHFSRLGTISALGAVLVGTTIAVMGCAASQSVSPVPLPDDTEDTAFVRASPESTANYGVAYWGVTPDADRSATTVVGYGANNERIVNLRYDIDHDFALDLSGPGIDARMRVDMATDATDPGGAPPPSQPNVSGVTDAAVQLYDQIVADARQAAEEKDDATATGLVGTQAIHPTANLVQPYSKALLDHCWTQILDCRAKDRALLKTYQSHLLTCGPTNAQLTGAKGPTASLPARTDVYCTTDLRTDRDNLTSGRAACETKRTDCLKAGTAPPPANCNTTSNPNAC